MNYEIFKKKHISLSPVYFYTFVLSDFFICFHKVLTDSLLLGLDESAPLGITCFKGIAQHFLKYTDLFSGLSSFSSSSSRAIRDY